MKNILVPIDFSDVTQKIIQQAIQIASSLKADVRLIHVTTPSSSRVKLHSEIITPAALDGMEGQYFAPIRHDIIRDQIATQFKEEHSKLIKFRQQFVDKKIKTLALLIEGEIVESIIAEAQKIKADIIILGSHGHSSIYKAFLGSVTNGVLKKPTCPVLIVPAKKEK